MGNEVEAAAAGEIAAAPVPGDGPPASPASSASSNIEDEGDFAEAEPEEEAPVVQLPPDDPIREQLVNRPDEILRCVRCSAEIREGVLVCHQCGRQLHPQPGGS